MLTTLFGTTQLALQHELRRKLDTSSDEIPRAPNFIVVSLHHDKFIAEHRGEVMAEIERFRRDLETAMRAFLSAHEWSVGGSGTIVINIVLRGIDEPCIVDARIERSFYELEVEDDRGSRTVPVGSNPTTIGRAHEPYPRGFVSIYDNLKLVSRQHILLTYRDLTLYARLLGRNPTTLNGAELGTDDVELHNGDVMVCGAVEVKVKI